MSCLTRRLALASFCLLYLGSATHLHAQAMAQQPQELPLPRPRYHSHVPLPINPAGAVPLAAPLVSGPGGASLSAATWTPIGPSSLPNTFNGNVSGRITGVAVDPTNDSIIYVTPADGGIWKTTDDGKTWTPLTDNQTTLAMGAIAIAPNKTLRI